MMHKRINFFLGRCVSILVVVALFTQGIQVKSAYAMGETQTTARENALLAVDLRQNGAISISGALFEGGKVYLTIPVKNFGSSATPKMHVYTEGYTALGKLWRADGAQPAAVIIQPGQTVTFTVQHDMWEGHAGTWSTYGVCIWNDANGTYYGPLAANGYNQQVSFNVLPGPDIRQNGPIQSSNSLFQGGKVKLTIPVINIGGVATNKFHVYTEGYTPLNKLWRADGAQPTAVVLQPGESTTITVQHDLWWGHTGTWSTYGVYIWNDDSNTYQSPLDANGYNQKITFAVGLSPLRSLDIRYLDNTNDAFIVSYSNEMTLADGSLLADVTVRNWRKVPYMLHVELFGIKPDANSLLYRYSQPRALPMLPESEITFRNVLFSRGSKLEIHTPMFGYNDDDRFMIYGLHGIEILSIGVLGVIPNGDAFKTYEDLTTSGFGMFADALHSTRANFLLFGYQLGKGDFLDAFETLIGIVGDNSEAVANASKAVLKSPLSAQVIANVANMIALFMRSVVGGEYLGDLALSPGFGKITLVPSSRLIGEISFETPSHRTLSAESSGNPGAQAASFTGAAGSILLSHVAGVSSSQSANWSPDLVIDGNPATGWSSGGTTPVGEWITLDLNNRPALLRTVQIDPGPCLDDHTGAALKDFHIDVSMDGINYKTVLQGSFSSFEFNKNKEFAVTPPAPAAYVRLVVDSNQTGDSVFNVDVAEIAIYGDPYSTNDIYEPDSSASIARWTSGSGALADHTFSYPGDQDWLRVETVARKHYLVSARPQDKKSAVSVKIYAADLSTIILSKTGEPGMAVVLGWYSSDNSDYYVVFSHSNPSAWGDSTNYVSTVQKAEYISFMPIIQR